MKLSTQNERGVTNMNTTYFNSAIKGASLADMRNHLSHEIEMKNSHTSILNNLTAWLHMLPESQKREINARIVEAQSDIQWSNEKIAMLNFYMLETVNQYKGSIKDCLPDTNKFYHLA